MMATFLLDVFCVVKTGTPVQAGDGWSRRRLLMVKRPAGRPRVSRWVSCRGAPLRTGSGCRPAPIPATPPRPRRSPRSRAGPRTPPHRSGDSVPITGRVPPRSSPLAAQAARGSRHERDRAMDSRWPGDERRRRRNRRRAGHDIRPGAGGEVSRYPRPPRRTIVRRRVPSPMISRALRASTRNSSLRPSISSSSDVAVNHSPTGVGRRWRTQIS